MDKRLHKRVRRRLSVRFGEDELTNRGYTRDISAGGAFVVCGQLPAVGTRLRLEIQLGGDKRLRAFGIVRRAHHVPLQLRQVEAMGFGLAFLGGRPVELDERHEPAGPRLLEIHYATGAALREAWQRTLRIGGALVGSEQPVSFGERVHLRVCLDFAGQSLVWPAKVARVLDGPPRMVAVAFEDPQAVRSVLASYVAS